MIRATTFAMLSAVVLTPAAAQQDTTDAPRPFVEGGAFDKPYLAQLLGRTAIGGYAEAHTRFERVDGATEELGFEAKRFNLFTSTQVSDFVRIGAELEVEEGGQEIKLEYAAIDVGIHQAVSLRAGMLLSPLGRFNLSHDSPKNEFTDRPAVATDLLGVALSEPGIGAFGLFGIGDGAARITYELYAVNGFGEGLVADSPDGTRIANGRQNFEDANASPAVVGRVTYSPRAGWELGLSSHHGAYNVFKSEGQALEDRRDIHIWVLDFEAEPVGLRVSGELATVSVDIPPGLIGIYASGQRGFYVEALRDFGRGWVPTMTTSYFSAGARLDVVDFDTSVEGDTGRRLTGGLNFRPTQDTVLKLNYFRGWDYDRANNRADYAGILFSVATYF